MREDGAVSLDLAVDIAFGVMWYRLLSGHAPVDGALAAEIAAALGRCSEAPEVTEAPETPEVTGVLEAAEVLGALEAGRRGSGPDAVIRAEGAQIAEPRTRRRHVENTSNSRHDTFY